MRITHVAFGATIVVALLAACTGSVEPVIDDRAAVDRTSVDQAAGVPVHAALTPNGGTITLPPPSLSGPTDATVGVGQGVQFGVLASGQGPFTYQWWRSAGGTGPFVAAGAGSGITVPVTTLANHGDIYRVRVTDRFGIAATAQATLRVVKDGWAPLTGRALSSINGVRQPSLALCDQPSLAVVATSSGRDVVHVYRFDGLAWRHYGALSPATPTGGMSEPSLDCVFDGTSARPIVAWSEGDSAARNIYVRYWDGAAWKDTQPAPLNRVAGSRAIKPVLRVTPYDPTVDHVVANGVTRRSAVAWIENGVPSVRRWDGAQWAPPFGGVAIADPSANGATDIALKIDLEYQQQYPVVVAWLRAEASGHSPYAAIHAETALPNGTRIGGWSSLGTRGPLGGFFSEPAGGIHLATGKLGQPSLAIPMVVRAELPLPNRVRSHYLESANYLNLVSNQPWPEYARPFAAPAQLKALSLDGNELPRLNCLGVSVPVFGLAVSDTTGFEVRTGNCNNAQPAIWQASLPRHPVPLERVSLRMAGVSDPYVAGAHLVNGVSQVSVWRYFP